MTERAASVPDVNPVPDVRDEPTEVDPVELLRRRAIAVQEAADAMSLSYGQMVYNRGAIEERLTRAEKTVYDLKALLNEGVTLSQEGWSHKPSVNGRQYETGLSDERLAGWRRRVLLVVK